MKRFKRVLQWTGIVLSGLVAIGLVANAVFVWTTDTRLDSQLTAIREAGDPLSLADLARPPIPPEMNAATFLRRAEAGIEGIHREVAAVPGFWQFFDTEDSMPSEIQKALKATFTAYPDVIPLVQQAAACPDYDAQLDYTLSAGEFIAKMLPVLQNVRDAGRVLQFRVRLLVAEGNYDEAVRTALLLFRLAHHYERNPALAGYLVAATIQGMAVDCANAALQAGPVSKEVRQALDAELALQEPMEGYIWALKSDRVLTLGIFAQFPFRHFWLIGRGTWNRREWEYLDKMRTLLALLREPIPYRQAEHIILGKPYDQHWEMRGDPIGEWERQPFLMVPATLSCAARTQAEIRSLRVLNALQTHASAGTDATPKLSELGLPIETTTDPFNGELLHVAKTRQGWLIYSVGRNYRDDGGKLDDPSDGDVGVGPPPATTKPAGGIDNSTIRVPQVRISQPPFDSWKMQDVTRPSSLDIGRRLVSRQA